MSSSSPNPKSPPRRSGMNPLKPVSAPLSKVSFRSVVYVIGVFAVGMVALYTYQIIQVKNEVGGWAGLLFGPRPRPTPNIPQYTPESTGKSKGKGKSGKKDGASNGPAGVEESINALAIALGMPPTDLSRAIAGAVQQFVPPASLSSIRERETGKPAVDEMFKAQEALGKAGEATQPGTAKSGGSTGIVGQIVEGMETVVGMDEP